MPGPEHDQRAKQQRSMQSSAAVVAGAFGIPHPAVDVLVAALPDLIGHLANQPEVVRHQHHAAVPPAGAHTAARVSHTALRPAGTSERCVVAHLLMASASASMVSISKWFVGSSNRNMWGVWYAICNSDTPLRRRDIVCKRRDRERHRCLTCAKTTRERRPSESSSILVVWSEPEIPKRPIARRIFSTWFVPALESKPSSPTCKPSHAVRSRESIEVRLWRSRAEGGQGSDLWRELGLHVLEG